MIYRYFCTTCSRSPRPPAPVWSGRRPARRAPRIRPCPPACCCCCRLLLPLLLLPRLLWADPSRSQARQLLLPPRHSPHSRARPARCAAAAASAVAVAAVGDVAGPGCGCGGPGPCCGASPCPCAPALSPSLGARAWRTWT